MRSVRLVPDAELESDIEVLNDRLLNASTVPCSTYSQSSAWA